MANGAFAEVYELISSALFNGSPEAYTYGALICEGFAAIFSIALVALPFVVVWRIIRRFL